MPVRIAIGQREVIRIAASILLSLVFLASAQTLRADIYMHTDSEGVVHLTNHPLSPDYRLLVKEPVRRAVPGGENNYDELIREAERLYDVEFSLLKAIMKVESNFNPRAVSKKGAAGLMQIMPCNFTALHIRNPFDPRENIFGGARYIRRMLDRFNGEVPLALAAYNAGPEIVGRLRKIPPIGETQSYVERVMKFYSLFKQR